MTNLRPSSIGEAPPRSIQRAMSATTLGASSLSWAVQTGWCFRGSTRTWGRLRSINHLNYLPLWCMIVIFKAKKHDLVGILFAILFLKDIFIILLPDQLFLTNLPLLVILMFNPFSLLHYSLLFLTRHDITSPGYWLFQTCFLWLKK